MRWPAGTGVSRTADQTVDATDDRPIESQMGHTEMTDAGGQGRHGVLRVQAAQEGVAQAELQRPQTRGQGQQSKGGGQGRWQDTVVQVQMQVKQGRMVDHGPHQGLNEIHCTLIDDAASIRPKDGCH